MFEKTPFTAFLSRMSQESQHTRFEDQILGQISLWGRPASCASLGYTRKNAFYQFASPQPCEIGSQKGLF